MLPKVTPVLPSKSARDVAVVLANPDSYVYEQKLDGWRCIAYVDSGEVELSTKRSLAHQGFADVRTRLLALGFEQAIFDGEIVCLDGRGNPDFGALMRRRGTVYYYIFDLLWLNGMDIRHLPLIERKEHLRRVLNPARRLLRYIEHCGVERYSELADRVKQQDLEGVVAKLSNAQYDPELRRNWVKLLNSKYSDPPGRQKFLKKK